MQDTQRSQTENPHSQSTVQGQLIGIKMDNATFIAYNKTARTIEGEYGLGYRMGLLKKFFGDSYHLPKNIETLLKRENERGEGLRHGLAGIPPSSKYISENSAVDLID